MATNITDLPHDLTLMLCSYLGPKDLLNLRLANRELHASTSFPFAIAFLSETLVDFSKDGLQRLSDLSTQPGRKYVKKIIFRAKPKTEAESELLSLLHLGFCELERFENVQSVGIRRDMAPANDEIDTEGCDRTTEILLDTLLPVVLTTKLVIKEVLYDFVINATHTSSEPPWVTFGPDCDQLEAGVVLSRLTKRVPKHLQITCRFVPSVNPSSPYPSVSLARKTRALTSHGTSIHHWDMATDWFRRLRLTALSLRDCVCDDLIVLHDMRLNPLRRLCIDNMRLYHEHNLARSNVWRRKVDTCTSFEWLRVFSHIQALPDLEYLRLGKLGMGTDEYYMAFTYEAHGRARVQALLTQLRNGMGPDQSFLVPDEASS